MSSPLKKPVTAAPTAVQGGASSTLRRFNMFSSTRLQRKCPNCLDASVIILDHHTGDELCSRCGLVIESRVLSEEQEWRSFSNTESGSGSQDRSRVAGPNNAWIDSGVQGTAMMGGDKKHSRLMQTHEMTTAISGSDKMLLTAFGNLKSITEFFNLRDNVLERCREIVKDLQTADQLRSRTGDVYMLSVTYLACREEQIPKGLKELVSYNRTITEKELGRAINRLKKLLPSRRQPVAATSADLMPRVCQGLQLSRQITNVAEHVSRQAERLINRGHRPNSLAAGAVYLVTQICGLDIDAYDIATIAKTGASTVQAVYRELLPISNQLLPPDFNPSVK